MKLPPYTHRTRRDLQRAFRWAQRQLSLTDWDVTFVFDGEVRLHPLFEGEVVSRAINGINTEGLHLVVGVLRSVGQADNVDPLFSLFHEAGHLACWWHGLVDRNYQADDLWEQLANRFAVLLWGLYPHK